MQSLGSLQLLLCLLLFAPSQAMHAVTVHVSSGALETTLQRQLFKDAEHRYYLRGTADSACFVYAEDPHVSFRDGRVVVHVKTYARLGTAVRGSCIGLAVHLEADVTLTPESDGETIGFRDARVENLSQSRELNFFLQPFLSRKLPQHMKLNAAALLRAALANSRQTTGYDLQLPAFTIRSLQVSHDALIVDVDGDLVIS